MASLETWFIAAVLVIGNIINIILMKPGRLKKREKAIISLFSIVFVASTATNLYSHYASEPLHIMNHTLFKTAYILSMLILVQENILTVLTLLYSVVETGVFDQLNYLLAKISLTGAKSLYSVVETGVFDQLNYLFARITLTTSKMLRRIQTGNLNLNMLMILIFFLLCLILLIL